MSDFRRNLFLQRIKQEEARLGVGLSQEEDEDEDELASLPSVVARPRQPEKPQDVEMVKWNTIFTENAVLEIGEGYKVQTYFLEPKGEENPVIFVGHHGAGSSAMTYGPLAKSLAECATAQNSGDIPGFFCFDARDHGENVVLNSTRGEVSLEKLSCDFVEMLEAWFKQKGYKERGIRPSLFLIGHSLGGSVLTKVVKDKMVTDSYVSCCIKGLVMLDIVEETAVKALGSMQGYLDNRPKVFGSLREAVDWHVSSGLVHNRSSALVSVPYLFRKVGSKYVWSADLQATKPFWEGWFLHLSSNFTAIPNTVAKMLILANHDNLDKNLMIGQMQGKYQLVVFHNGELPLSSTLTTATTTVNDSSEIGHFVHEDIPHKAALTLLEFVERNDISRATTSNPQIDFLNKINAKWGVKRTT